MQNSNNGVFREQKKKNRKITAILDTTMVKLLNKDKPRHSNAC
jgi:hypothetical protein